ncbi:MAG: S8 family serine peptidase [Candidatus Limnocylindrales bacterium]
MVLSGKTDTRRFVKAETARHGIKVGRSFSRAFRGFTASLDKDQRKALLADPAVLQVVPEAFIELAGQTTPNGIRRIGGRSSAAAAIDGTDQRVNVDVAIVDTGIASHPDLNVVGGYNCAGTDRSAWRDYNNHGTHVAGTVAALDNGFGVVGVAPGARLWAVRILNDDGYGLLSWYVCGLDWILAQRDPNDASRPLIEAVNMSVTKSGSDDHACGATNNDILHAAICRVVAGGITVVAAAANDSANAAKRIPASYDEVITVSALADTDGRAGGLGGNGCFSWGTYDQDDTFANFSNYGDDVDIIAPGKCIWSTVPGGYGYSSGTSMAAPEVTGASALYKASRPLVSPADVKEALQYLGNLDWKTATDPDGRHEKLLNVSRLGKLGTFGFEAASAAAEVGESGGTSTVAITLRRSSSFFERVRFLVTSAPPGWTVTLSDPSLIGWTANATSLRVAVPAGVAEGDYRITLTGTNQGRTKSITIPVAVTNDVPTALPPTVAPITGTTVGVRGTIPRTLTLRVSWPPATDISSQIAGYQVEHRVDGGPWTDGGATPASIRSLTFAGLDLTASHEFRVRASDSVGNWSPWARIATDQRFRTVGDRSASVTYGGTWRRAEVASATNGVRTTSSRAGSVARLTFTGRGIAVVMPRSRVRGKVGVYLDGALAATVDTRAATVQARRVVFQRTWTRSGTHTIRLRVAGTSRRPVVSLDGFVILR